MRALILDENFKTKLTSLKEYAEKNICSSVQILARLANPDLAPGYNPQFVRILPVGFRVVFTHEDITPINRNGAYAKAMIVRHMSISLTDAPEGKLPNPAAVNEIMKQLGYAGKSDDGSCMVNVGGGIGESDKNIIQIIEIIK